TFMFDAGINNSLPFCEQSTRPSFSDITNTPQRACVRLLSLIARLISAASVESGGAVEIAVVGRSTAAAAAIDCLAIFEKREYPKKEQIKNTAAPHSSAMNRLFFDMMLLVNQLANRVAVLPAASSARVAS